MFVYSCSYRNRRVITKDRHLMVISRNSTEKGRRLHRSVVGFHWPIVQHRLWTRKNRAPFSYTLFYSYVVSQSSRLMNHLAVKEHRYDGKSELVDSRCSCLIQNDHKTRRLIYLPTDLAKIRPRVDRILNRIRPYAPLLKFIPHGRYH